jgi:hypothetical protein
MQAFAPVRSPGYLGTMNDRADEWRKIAGAHPREGTCWRCGQTRRVIRVFTFEVGKGVTAKPGESIPGRDLCFRCFLELR